MTDPLPPGAFPSNAPNACYGFISTLQVDHAELWAGLLREDETQGGPSAQSGSILPVDTPEHPLFQSFPNSGHLLGSPPALLRPNRKYWDIAAGQTIGHPMVVSSQPPIEEEANGIFIEDDDDNNETKAPKFVLRLFQLVQDPNTPCIQWTSDGKHFFISDTQEFMEVMDCKTKHFTSIIRSLSGYSFTKSKRASAKGADNIMYHHKHFKFLRDQPQLLNQIRRRAAKVVDQAEATAAAAPANAATPPHAFDMPSPLQPKGEDPSVRMQQDIDALKSLVEGLLKANESTKAKVEEGQVKITALQQMVDGLEGQVRDLSRILASVQEPARYGPGHKLLVIGSPDLVYGENDPYQAMDTTAPSAIPPRVESHLYDPSYSRSLTISRSLGSMENSTQFQPFPNLTSNDAPQEPVQNAMMAQPPFPSVAASINMAREQESLAVDDTLRMFRVPSKRRRLSSSGNGPVEPWRAGPPITNPHWQPPQVQTNDPAFFHHAQPVMQLPPPTKPGAPDGNNWRTL
ncbi:stress-responsive transcription factor hsf1 [Tulasnella sp. 331]|nr:stress-responsive transcription factor hsf1 [Tulasnella sp. 331]